MVSRLVVAATLAASPAAQAQPSPQPREIVELSRQWMDAVDRHDRAVIERLTASDFTLNVIGKPAAQSVNRSEWITNAMQLKFANFRFLNARAEVEGNHALVSADLMFDISPMPFALDSAVIDEWVLRDGRWQVKARWLGANRWTVNAKLIGAFALGVIVTLLAARWRMPRMARKSAGSLV